MPNGLMFSVKDYVVLVEDTGRIMRDDKHGAISSSSQAILNKPAENWLKINTEFTLTGFQLPRSLTPW